MPVRYSRDRVVFTGRPARMSFERWAETPEGLAVVEPLASAARFSLFGRMRSARGRLWRDLNHAARTRSVVAAVQRELDAYLPRLDKLVFARDLARVGVDLHRLVVVPRVFVNAEAYRSIDAALESQPAFARLTGGRPLRKWFAVTIVDAAASAVAQARPSLQRPLPAGDGWITVGVNEQFEWRVPFDGPAWPGHYFVLEVTRAPITRAFRKAAGDAIAKLEASIPSLSRSERVAILREAGSSLDQLLARA